MPHLKDDMLESEELNLRGIIAILKRRRRLIGTTVLVGLGVAFVFLIAASPVFRASVLLQVDNRESSILDPGSGPSDQSAVLSARVDGEVEILRSEATALAVVEAAGLVTDPEYAPRVGWFERLGMALGTDLDGNGLRRLVGLSPRPEPGGQDLVNGIVEKLLGAVRVRRRGMTYLIEVTVSSGDPGRAAAIANLYAETYIRRQVAAKIAGTVEARDVLLRQIEIAGARLAASDEAVNRFIESNLDRLEQESGNREVAALREGLEAARRARAEVAGRLARVEGAIAGQEWQGLAETLGDAALAELARQREETRRRLDGAISGSNEAQDLEGRLAALDADLAGRAGGSAESIRGDLAALDKREAEARDGLRHILLGADLSAGLVTELFNLQQGAAIARDKYQTLLAREQDLGTQANLQVAHVRVVSEALPPRSPGYPDKSFVLLFALFGGAGLGVALALLKEFYVGGIVSPGQLQNVLQARVPTTIPHVETAARGQPADNVALMPMSPYAESFRKLRAAIDIGSEGVARGGGRRGRVILLASAIPAEGKTTAAISLARTYALAGDNTLLIDTDLRKPAVGARLGIDGDTGLSDFLASPEVSDLSQMIPIVDPLSPLAVLTAGKRSAMPTEHLINSAAFRALIDIAAETYDVVILDTPPLLPLVDTRYVARLADVVVQIVRFGTTTQGEAREAAALLQDMMRPETPFFGVLGHEERGGGHYAYSERYSYYGHGEAGS